MPAVPIAVVESCSRGVAPLEVVDRRARDRLRTADRQGVVVPEKALAEAANTSVRDGGRLLQPAETAATMPQLETALNEGRVSGEHVDAVCRVLRTLEPAVQQRLADEGERLVTLAQHSTPDEFARSLRGAARRVNADNDGLERLAQQRRAVRFSSWVDKETGMGRSSRSFEPKHC